MSERFRRYYKQILSLILAVQVIGLGCISAYSASFDKAATAGQNSAESLSPLFSQESAVADTTLENYSRWLSEHYSADIFTREMWLRELLGAVDIEITSHHAEIPFDDADAYSCRDIFLTAYEHGIIDASGYMEPYSALTRGFVAATLVRAMGYESKTVSPVADAKDGEMLTAIYYGYFIPDDDDMVYPDAVITSSEYDELLSELNRCQQFRGKRILAFGDSIMYGTGNDSEGIADIIGEKYHMSVADYSVSGATFGISEGRSHIADQINKALKVNEDADIILINGATNDMVNVSLGAMKDGYEISSFNEKNFAGGFEYAMAMLKNYYGDVPTLYIRVHNMDLCDDHTEQEFGDLALTLAKKWSVRYVDLYHDTGMNTEDGVIRDKYTLYRENKGYHDSVHPTALGYAKHYLPLITKAVFDLINGGTV